MLLEWVFVNTLLNILNFLALIAYALLPITVVKFIIVRSI